MVRTKRPPRVVEGVHFSVAEVNGLIVGASVPTVGAVEPRGQVGLSVGVLFCYDVLVYQRRFFATNFLSDGGVS